MCLENRNDGTEFGGSIYQKVNEKIETSINLAWTAGSNNTRFGIAAKYKLDCRTSLSVRMCCQMGSALRVSSELQMDVVIRLCFACSSLHSAGHCVARGASP